MTLKGGVATPAATMQFRFRQSRRAFRLAFLSLFFFVLCCAERDGGDAFVQPERLMVFAASSLHEASESLAKGFESKHPGVAVVLSYAGSQVLSLQIEGGAGADVFASANRSHLDELVTKGHVEAPVHFASNRLALIVPKDNPAGIREFADLTKAERLVVGAANVPIGQYTRTLLTRADSAFGKGFSERVMARVVSQEKNVRLVRAKVELGEADAALVYQTDARGVDTIEDLSIDDEINVRAEYGMAVVTDTKQKRWSHAWVRFVQSAEGRRILRLHGLEVP